MPLKHLDTLKELRLRLLPLSAVVAFMVLYQTWTLQLL
jgi:hypothetical protein